MFVNGVSDMAGLAVWPLPVSLFLQPLFTFIYMQLFIVAQFGDYAQEAGACPGDADGARRGRLEKPPA
jgi:hypothetical protein